MKPFSLHQFIEVMELDRFITSIPAAELLDELQRSKINQISDRLEELHFILDKLGSGNASGEEN
jgi:hypothetical protein